MRLFGFEISKAAPPSALVPTARTPIGHDRGSWWWPIIREPYTGAWQRNDEIRAESITTYFAVYACISLIAQDIGKLTLRLMGKTEADIWQPAENPAFSPLLRKPNHFQTRGQFIEQWIISKLIHGNTYVLKYRDARRVITQLYVLDPTRTKVLVAPNGDVFYELAADNLSGLELPVTVPKSEIIHDVMAPFFHPLCGLSPLVAAALPVSQGLNIQRASSQFFHKGSRPGGILTTPHPIDEEQSERLKAKWEQTFSGENAGRVAVIGDGLKFEPMGMPAEEAQLIEQLKWTAENVCSVFHVPGYMIGIAPTPTYNNVEALQQVYYSQCLQSPIEAIKSLLDEALLLNVPPINYRTDFDLEDLLRMDTATLIDSTAKAVTAGIVGPNEGRKKFNLPPVPGGEWPMAQIQDESLPAKAERERLQLEAARKPAPAPEDEPEDEPETEEPPNGERIFALSKTFG